AELVVGDVVTDAQAEFLGAGGAGQGPAAAAPGRTDGTGGQLALPGRRPAGVGPPGQVHELLGDLGEEPAGGVVLGRAEEVPAPGVAEVEPLPGPGDADVTEPALLVELVGVAQ